MQLIKSAVRKVHQGSIILTAGDDDGSNGSQLADNYFYVALSPEDGHVIDVNKCCLTFTARGVDRSETDYAQAHIITGRLTQNPGIGLYLYFRRPQAVGGGGLEAQTVIEWQVTEYN